LDHDVVGLKSTSMPANSKQKDAQLNQIMLMCTKQH